MMDYFLVQTVSHGKWAQGLRFKLEPNKTATVDFNSVVPMDTFFEHSQWKVVDETEFRIAWTRYQEATHRIFRSAMESQKKP